MKQKQNKKILLGINFQIAKLINYNKGINMQMKKKNK